ncbi:MAG: tail fiber domain-containing protein [Bacteroidetes bacterium]|nr:tail fiber domain-containing protein [Bacteroidota bacterium]MBU1115651.1 tail fiber domain-containing protein [Bacteroidota bacterium]MBU1799963.1 tail fiber domain-containing protein [Bacteroidota bacterium]
MKKLLLTLTFALLATQLFAQNDIINTLGTNGSFIVKDVESTFLTLSGNGESNTAVSSLNVNGNAAFTWATSAFAPNLSAGRNVIHMIGKAGSEYNAGYIGFNFVESGSAGNFLTFGLHSHDNLFNITGAGNVGIGTTGPQAKLDVAGAINIGTSQGEALKVNTGSAWANQVLLRTGWTDGIGDWSELLVPGGTDNTANLRLTSNGNVGIGTTTPSYPLHVTSYATTTNDPGYFFTGSTSELTATYGNWNVGIYSVNSILTNGAFVAFSDLRIKENIKEVQHSLDLVRKLRPVSYNKIDKIENGGRTEFGFIAQEVEKILPDAVNTGTGEIPVLKPFDKVEFEDGVTYTILVKNGDDIKEQTYTKDDVRPTGEIIVKSKTVDDFKSLSYDMIFTVAVDAIQEQQTQIEAQQKQIDELKAANSLFAQKLQIIDELKVELINMQKALENKDSETPNSQIRLTTLENN